MIIQLLLIIGLSSFKAYKTNIGLGTLNLYPTLTKKVLC